MSACILCGVKGEVIFRFVPPTAGARVLSLDGGGVRGVIPLIFLSHLQSLLSQLECPIQEFFDFVCGTSAGTYAVFLT